MVTGNVPLSGFTRGREGDEGKTKICMSDMLLSKKHLLFKHAVQ